MADDFHDGLSCNRLRVTVHKHVLEIHVHVHYTCIVGTVTCTCILTVIMASVKSGDPYLTPGTMRQKSEPWVWEWEYVSMGV